MVDKYNLILIPKSIILLISEGIILILKLLNLALLSYIKSQLILDLLIYLFVIYK